MQPDIFYQNLPHDLDLDEDELLGMVTNVSVPGGHLDNSITLVIPQGRITCNL